MKTVSTFTLRQNLTGVLTFIPAGEYWMGSEQDGPAEHPLHRVSLSGFWCARKPVTRGELQVFLNDVDGCEAEHWGLSAHDIQALLTMERDRGEADAHWHDHPAIGLSWFDAWAYARWLSAKTSLRYRLPTEAEWERAARGGVEGLAFPWGNAPAECVGANFGYLGDMTVPLTVPCGTLPQNGFGLYIGGNCWEWVNDWYDPDYYRTSPYMDPAGPDTGRFRVRRGGAFNNRQAFRLRVASRNRLAPDRRFPNMGVRLVRSPEPNEYHVPTGISGDAVPGVERTIPSPADWDHAIRKRLHGSISVRERVEAVLDVLRPNMIVDGGGVCVESIQDGGVRLAMMGTCHACPKSPMTFADISETLRRCLPELTKVERVEE